MGKILAILCIAGATGGSVHRPWIGAVAAYLLIVLVPQAVWWWNFDGLRPAFWVTLGTLAGLVIAVLRGMVDFRTLANKRTLFVLAMWAFVTLSYYAGPYIGVESQYDFVDSEWAISIVHKMMLLYFIACLVIDSERKLKTLVWVVTASGIYLIYWANMRYLSGTAFGRMSGPTSMGGTGIYADENNFAMLFVVVLPFVWFLSFTLRNKLLRWGMWLIIPFGWHAIFLTGSRGGLVGIAATMAIMVVRMKAKWLGLLMVPAFAIAFVWQGGVLQERAGTIAEYESDGSAVGRLQAWEAASRMMLDHPITGIGIGAFGAAFPDYSTHQPRAAHNTFFQIASESGLVAGLGYLCLVAVNLLALWRNGKRLQRQRNPDGTLPALYWINESVLVGFSGLVVCSMFLSLQLFEIFYCLTVMVNALMYLVWKEEQPPEKALQPADVRRMRRNRGVPQRALAERRGGAHSLER